MRRDARANSRESSPERASNANRTSRATGCGLRLRDDRDAAPFVTYSPGPLPRPSANAGRARSSRGARRAARVMVAVERWTTPSRSDPGDCGRRRRRSRAHRCRDRSKVRVPRRSRQHEQLGLLKTPPAKRSPAHAKDRPRFAGGIGRVPVRAVERSRRRYSTPTARSPSNRLASRVRRVRRVAGLGGVAPRPAAARAFPCADDARSSAGCSTRPSALLRSDTAIIRSAADQQAPERAQQTRRPEQHLGGTIW